MRILEMRAKPVTQRGVFKGLVRTHGFAAGLAASVLAYGLMLVLHPGMERGSPYPEPVGNVLHDANFPGSTGAGNWMLEIHESGGAATCRGATASHYREVPAKRCGSLMKKWAADALLPLMDNERCRYHYAGLDAAHDGRDVSFVTAGDRCVVPKG